MRKPEFQLVAWTMTFYMQVEQGAAVISKPGGAKAARTTPPATDRKPRR